MKNVMWLLVISWIGMSACKKEETSTEVETEPSTEQPVVTQPESEPEPEVSDGIWVTTAKYGVRFRVPDDWKIKETAEVSSATSPDDKITIILVGTGSETAFEAAMSSISSEVKISELKTEKAGVAMVNGLAGFRGSGSAVLELESGPQEIQFLGYTLRTDADNAVALMIFAEAEMYEARKEELEGIIKTIQKSS